MEFLFKENRDGPGYGVFIREGSNSYVTSVTMTYVVPGSIINPAFNASKAELQAMADALWDAGIKPSAMKNVEAEMSATKAHLNDMRQIAFAKIKISMPGSIHTGDKPQWVIRTHTSPEGDFT